MEAKNLKISEMPSLDAITGNEIIPVVSEGENKSITTDKFHKAINVENAGSGEVTIQIKPNKFYKFGECTTLNVTLSPEEEGIYNEYCFKFDSGIVPTELNLPDNIMWIGNNTIDTNTKYIVSIVDNLAVIGGSKIK